MDNNFRYADKEEQLKRANHFLIVGYMVFFALVTVIMWVFCALHVRSVGLAGMMTILLAVATIVLLILGRKLQNSPKLKYVSIPITVILSFFIGFAFTQGFVQLLALYPLIGCILFYDKKYIKQCSIAYGGMEILITLAKIASGQNLEDNSPVNQIFVCVVYLVLLFLIYMITSVGQQFNDHSIGQANTEKQHIQAMMNDVMDVANEIRQGTENAMEIVNNLNASSGIVNGAMKDISSSTQSTAENIQVQTEMTSNIQDSIQTTLLSSDKMVSVANQSGELNNRSLDVMNQLKEQSQVISSTSAEVAEIMSELRTRTNAVKSIADTIFSISSQTNLLALNASIESARAGEAGRGFAVVADEIRQLAEKTRLETESIAKISDELSSTAETAAKAVTRSIDATTAQDEMISEASKSFEEVNSNMNELLSEINSISEMLNNLSSANNQIVDGIMNLSATTEEVTASSAQAADLSVENLENAEEAKKQLTNILEVSHQLDKYLD